MKITELVVGLGFIYFVAKAIIIGLAFVASFVIPFAPVIFIVLFLYFIIRNRIRKNKVQTQGGVQ